MGMHLALTQGVFARIVADFVPVDLRGTGFGIFDLARGLAFVIANMIAGWWCEPRAHLRHSSAPQPMRRSLVRPSFRHPAAQVIGSVIDRSPREKSKESGQCEGKTGVVIRKKQRGISAEVQVKLRGR